MLKQLMYSVLALAIALPLAAADSKKETDRLENCGLVLKESSTFPTIFRKTCSTKPYA